MFGAYVASLASAPLAAHTRRTYASKVRQYLVWLVGAEVDGDPLASAEGRDWAVRDYRGYLLGVLKRSPATVNGALARWMTSISAAGTGRPKRSARTGMDAERRVRSSDGANETPDRQQRRGRPANAPRVSVIDPLTACARRGELHKLRWLM